MTEKVRRNWSVIQTAVKSFGETIKRIWEGKRKVGSNNKVNGVKNETITGRERWNWEDINWKVERNWECLRFEIKMIQRFIARELLTLMKDQRTWGVIRGEGWHWWIEARNIRIESLIDIGDWWVRWKD